MTRERFLFALCELAAELIDRKMVPAAALVLEHRFGAALHLSDADLAELGYGPGEIANILEPSPAAEAVPSPAASKPASPPARTPAKRAAPSSASSASDTFTARVLSVFADGDRGGSDLVLETLELARSRSTVNRVSKTLSALCADGRLERVGRGVYKVAGAS